MADLVSVSIDRAAVAQIDRLLDRLSLTTGEDTALGRGVVRALNRAMVSARVVMVRDVAADLGVRQQDVRRYLGTHRASGPTLEARVFPMPRGKRGIPLGDLNPSGPEPSRGKGPGVRVQGRRYPRAFLSTMPQSSHRGVFQRVGTSRLPIQELRTKSVTETFAAHRSAGVARASESLSTNLVSELRYALQSAS